MSAITGIDHAQIGVADLARAAEAWRRLGFTLTPQGRHVGRPTGNHCVMLDHDYVELIGIVDPSGPHSRLADLLAEKGEGLIGLALAPTTADAAAAQFASAGVAAHPSGLERPVIAPDGNEALARFARVEIDQAATPDFRLFACEHLTRELVWRPEWTHHANTAVGIAGVTVLSANPPALADAYARLFGAGSLTMTDDVLTVFVGRTPVLFATPADAETMFPTLAGDIGGPLPRGFALTLEVADIDAAARHLAGAGVRFAQDGAGRLVVPPEAATGVLVEFRTRGTG